MISAAIELAKKDLKVYFRDPVAWLLGFMLPIVLVTIFGFLMGAVWGGGGPAPRVDLYVVDEDQTAKSRAFIDALRSSDMLRVRPRKDDAELDRQAVQQKIVDGEISHAIVIKEGFGGNGLNSGGDNALVLLRDPGRSMEDQIVRINLLQAMFRSGDGNWWVGSLENVFRDAGVADEQLKNFSLQASAMNSVINGFTFPGDDEADVVEDGGLEGDNTQEAGLENASSENESTETTTADPMGFFSKMLPLDTEDFSPPARPKQATYQIAQAVAGMSVMMLMFGVTSCSRTLIQERERGTMARLLSVGVPRTSLLAGTAIFTVVIGLLQLLVMFIYGELMFKVGIFRDPVTLVTLAVVWILTASSFGLLLAALAKSEKQADMLSTILIISMAALGGCWFPLQMLDLPTPFAMLTKSTATYWAMTGFQGMLWNNATLVNSRLMTAVLVQLGYTIVMGLGAIWLFNRNYVRA